MKRYVRQMQLADVGEAGQHRLQQARVLLIGLGGLGSPIALYLAAAGVGELVLVDFDSVEESNLQRQILYREDQMGQSKALMAAQAVQALNSAVHVEAIDGVLAGEALRRQVQRATVVVDATDNLTTRLAINAVCVQQKRPLVIGAAIRFEGQVMTYLPDQGPCYRCLYRSADEVADTCAQSGVIGPLLGIIGSLQALEVLKIIVGFGDALTGRLLMFEAKHGEWQELKIPRFPRCPVCGNSSSVGHAPHGLPN